MTYTRTFSFIPRMIIRSDSRICHFQRIIWNPFIWRYLSLLVRGSMVLFDEQINREYYADKYSWRFALSPQLIICIFVEMPLMCLRNHPWSPSRIPRTRLSSHYTYYLLISEWMIVHETRMVIHTVTSKWYSDSLNAVQIFHYNNYSYEELFNVLVLVFVTVFVVECKKA